MLTGSQVGQLDLGKAVDDVAGAQLGTHAIDKDHRAAGGIAAVAGDGSPDQQGFAFGQDRLIRVDGDRRIGQLGTADDQLKCTLGVLAVGLNGNLILLAHIRRGHLGRSSAQIVPAAGAVTLVPSGGVTVHGKALAAENSILGKRQRICSLSGEGANGSAAIFGRGYNAGARGRLDGAAADGHIGGSTFGRRIGLCAEELGLDGLHSVSLRERSGVVIRHRPGGDSIALVIQVAISNAAVRPGEHHLAAHRAGDGRIRLSFQCGGGGEHRTGNHGRIGGHFHLGRRLGGGNGIHEDRNSLFAGIRELFRSGHGKVVGTACSLYFDNRAITGLRIYIRNLVIDIRRNGKLHTGTAGYSLRCGADCCITLEGDICFGIAIDADRHIIGFDQSAGKGSSILHLIDLDSIAVGIVQLHHSIDLAVSDSCRRRILDRAGNRQPFGIALLVRSRNIIFASGNDAYHFIFNTIHCDSGNFYLASAGKGKIAVASGKIQIKRRSNVTTTSKFCSINIYFYYKRKRIRLIGHNLFGCGKRNAFDRRSVSSANSHGAQGQAAQHHDEYQHQGDQTAPHCMRFGHITFLLSIGYFFGTPPNIAPPCRQAAPAGGLCGIRQASGIFKIDHKAVQGSYPPVRAPDSTQL